MKVNHLVLVWHCCGTFGFTIPWAEWMCEGVYPCPPLPEAQALGVPIVYLYSEKGQLCKDALPVARSGGIDMDRYINRHGGVDWYVVLQELKAHTTWKDGTELNLRQLSLPFVC